MKKIKLLVFLSVLAFMLFLPSLCKAMPPGTLLYRTSSSGKMYGYSTKKLFKTKKGILQDIYPGHAAIYIGSEKGVDYVIEALSNGIVKTPLKYFVNQAQGEVFLGARIPKKVNALQIAKVVSLAKSLARQNLAYDFDFKKQKGPRSGEWTCVGLTEKLYESANISNPNNLGALEYDPNYYAVDITPDGFDNYSIVDKQKDVFSKTKEFSKISRKRNLLLPAPELFGFDLGREYQGERYFFFPYTQFLQSSLRAVKPDLPVSANFKNEEVRATVNSKLLVLRWSLINNPLSSLKSLARKTGTAFKALASRTKILAQNIKTKVFGENTLAQIVLANSATNNFHKTTSSNSVKGKTKKKSKTKTTSAKKVKSSSSGISHPLIKVNKIGLAQKLLAQQIAAAKKRVLAAKNQAISKDSLNTKAKLSQSSAKNQAISKDSLAKPTNSSAASKSSVASEFGNSSSSNNSSKSEIVKVNKTTETNSSDNSSSETTSTASPDLTSGVVTSGVVSAETPSIDVSDNWPKLAKINKVYATANNDFIELINISDHDFDLAEAGYRLEKAKTAENPSIMMRLGNTADGYYPKGTMIKAHGRYLIVRDDANSYYLAKASAVATRSDFSWSGSGYTIYLGTDSISSSNDADIVDAVGFGPDATYFQGFQPAKEIPDNYVLQRITSSANNYLDFSLVLTTDPAVLAQLAAQNNSNNNNNNNQSNNNTNNNSNDNTSDNNNTNSNNNSDNNNANTDTSTTTNTTNDDTATSTDNIATSTDDIATSTDDVATSTDNVATSTDDIATSTDDIATSTDDVATSTVDVATSTNDIATSTDDVATSTTDTATTSGPLPLALIDKIYSTDHNDFIELFNPNDYDFDLASSSYRLEKSKTALAPSLMMRLGNPADGSYPGGTIIKAQGKYLIVRDDANDYYKNQADAIAIRDEFTWADSGYTFYLATAPVSSSTDPDIKDLIGFGPDATYWQGIAPAPLIPDTYILNRIAYNHDNASDFNLILADDPAITNQPLDPNLALYTFPEPLISSGLTQLWHFSECYGTGHWAVGKWDCARELSYNYDSFAAPLNPLVNLNNFSVSFYYKASSAFPRIDLRLTNTQDDHLLLILDPGLITVEGLPNSEWRYYLPEVAFDNNWHRASLVVNQAEDYWAVYIDGKLMIKQVFFADLPTFSNIEMSDDNGSAIFDELAIWNRPLSPEEILSDYSADLPYSPLVAREDQSAAHLVHAWNFEEDYGASTLDSLNPLALAVDPTLWTGRKHNNYALGLRLGSNYTVNFLTPVVSDDLSLSFWWRNSSYPNGGRTNIYLTGGANNDTNILALLADYYRLGYWFNGQYGVLSEAVNEAIPYDDAWHHLALVYDSYRYKLNFYVDGEIKASSSLIRLKTGEAITGLRINDDNFNTAIDNLEVYAGALSPAQVKQLYLDTK